MWAPAAPATTAVVAALFRRAVPASSLVRAGGVRGLATSSSASTGTSLAASSSLHPDAAPPAVDAAAVERFRSEHRFRRLYDGRVQLLASLGEEDPAALEEDPEAPPPLYRWFDVKVDCKVEGALLFREAGPAISSSSSSHGGSGGSSGHVYYLVSDMLRQVDLSNDQLVGRLFRDGAWRRFMTPLEAVDQGGTPHHVRLTPKQFQDVFTLLAEGPAVQQAPKGADGA